MAAVIKPVKPALYIPKAPSIRVSSRGVSLGIAGGKSRGRQTPSLIEAMASAYVEEQLGAKPSSTVEQLLMKQQEVIGQLPPDVAKQAREKPSFGRQVAGGTLSALGHVLAIPAALVGAKADVTLEGLQEMQQGAAEGDFGKALRGGFKAIDFGGIRSTYRAVSQPHEHQPSDVLRGVARGEYDWAEGQGPSQLGKIPGSGVWFYQKFDEAAENPWAPERVRMVGRFGRGLEELIVDIALDPTTYLTGGVTKGAKSAIVIGSKYNVKVTKSIAAGEGTVADVAAKISRKEAGRRGALWTVARLADAAEETETTLANLFRHYGRDAFRYVDKKTAKAFMDEAGPKILRSVDQVPGGMRYFGTTVVKGETIRRILEPVYHAIDRLPVLANLSKTAAAIANKFSWADQSKLRRAVRRGEMPYNSTVIHIAGLRESLRQSRAVRVELADALLKTGIHNVADAVKSAVFQVLWREGDRWSRFLRSIDDARREEIQMLSDLADSGDIIAAQELAAIRDEAAALVLSPEELTLYRNLKGWTDYAYEVMERHGLDKAPFNVAYRFDFAWPKRLAEQEAAKEVIAETIKKRGVRGARTGKRRLVSRAPTDPLITDALEAAQRYIRDVANDIRDMTLLRFLVEHKDDFGRPLLVSGYRLELTAKGARLMQEAAAHRALALQLLEKITNAHTELISDIKDFQDAVKEAMRIYSGLADRIKVGGYHAVETHVNLILDKLDTITKLIARQEQLADETGEFVVSEALLKQMGELQDLVRTTIDVGGGRRVDLVTYMVDELKKAAPQGAINEAVIAFGAARARLGDVISTIKQLGQITRHGNLSSGLYKDFQAVVTRLARMPEPELDDILEWASKEEFAELSAEFFDAIRRWAQGFRDVLDTYYSDEGWADLGKILRSRTELISAFTIGKSATGQEVAPLLDELRTMIDDVAQLLGVDEMQARAILADQLDEVTRKGAGLAEEGIRKPHGFGGLARDVEKIEAVNAQIADLTREYKEIKSRLVRWLDNVKDPETRSAARERIDRLFSDEEFAARRNAVIKKLRQYVKKEALQERVSELFGVDIRLPSSLLSVVGKSSDAEFVTVSVMDALMLQIAIEDGLAETARMIDEIDQTALRQASITPPSRDEVREAILPNAKLPHTALNDLLRIDDAYDPATGGAELFTYLVAHGIDRAWLQSLEGKVDSALLGHLQRMAGIADQIRANPQEADDLAMELDEAVFRFAEEFTDRGMAVAAQIRQERLAEAALRGKDKLLKDLMARQRTLQIHQDALAMRLEPHIALMVLRNEGLINPFLVRYADEVANLPDTLYHYFTESAQSIGQRLRAQGVIPDDVEDFVQFFLDEADKAFKAEGEYREILERGLGAYADTLFDPEKGFAVFKRQPEIYRLAYGMQAFLRRKVMYQEGRAILRDFATEFYNKINEVFDEADKEAIAKIKSKKTDVDKLKALAQRVAADDPDALSDLQSLIKLQAGKMLASGVEAMEGYAQALEDIARLQGMPARLRMLHIKGEHLKRAHELRADFLDATFAAKETQEYGLDRLIRIRKQLERFSENVSKTYKDIRKDMRRALGVEGPFVFVTGDGQRLEVVEEAVSGTLKRAVEYSNRTGKPTLVRNGQGEVIASTRYSKKKREWVITYRSRVVPNIGKVPTDRLLDDVASIGAWQYDPDFIAFADQYERLLNTKIEAGDMRLVDTFEAARVGLGPEIGEGVSEHTIKLGHVEGVAAFIDNPNYRNLATLGIRTAKAPYADLMIHHRLYDSIKAAFEVSQMTDTVLDQVMRAWKFGILTIRPSRYIRDFISNMWLIASSGAWINPFRMANDVVTVMTGRVEPEVVQAAIDVGLLARQPSTTKGWRLSATGMSTFAMEELPVFGMKSSRLRKITEIGTTISNVNEQIARMTLFRRLVKDGMQPMAAADLVEEVLFNYAELTAFERGLRRTVMPFYTWFKKNLTYQLYLASRAPRAYFSLTSAPTMLSYQTTQQDRQPPLPSYVLQRLPIFVGKDYAITGADLPPTDLYRLVGAGASLVAPGVYTSRPSALRQYLGSLITGPYVSTTEAVIQETVSGRRLDPAQARERFLGGLVPGYSIYSQMYPMAESPEAGRYLETSRLQRAVVPLIPEKLYPAREKEAQRRIEILQQRLSEAKKAGWKPPEKPKKQKAFPPQVGSPIIQELLREYRKATREEATTTPSVFENVG